MDLLTKCLICILKTIKQFCLHRGLNNDPLTWIVPHAFQADHKTIILFLLVTVLPYLNVHSSSEICSPSARSNVLQEDLDVHRRGRES